MMTLIGLVILLASVSQWLDTRDSQRKLLKQDRHFDLGQQYIANYTAEGFATENGFFTLFKYMVKVTNN